MSCKDSLSEMVERTRAMLGSENEDSASETLACQVEDHRFAVAPLPRQGS